MRVECYWNLHLNCFSVRALSGPDKGRVIGHCGEVTLSNVRFVVRKSGLARFRRTGQKNVHAFVRGTLEYMKSHYAATRNAGLYSQSSDTARTMAVNKYFAATQECIPHDVTYNPARDESFVTVAFRDKMDSADLAVLFMNNGRPAIQAMVAAQ